jgi:hypothetical protein
MQAQHDPTCAAAEPWPEARHTARPLELSMAHAAPRRQEAAAPRFAPPALEILHRSMPSSRALAPPQQPALPTPRAEYLARELNRELYGSPARHASPLLERPPAEHPPLPRGRHSLQLPVRVKLQKSLRLLATCLILLARCSTCKS